MACPQACTECSMSNAHKLYVSFARKIMHESMLRLLESIYRLLDEQVLMLASNILASVKS